MDKSDIDYERSFAKFVARQLERDDRVEEVPEGFVEEFADSRTAKRAASTMEDDYYGTPTLTPVENRISELKKQLDWHRDMME